MIKETPSDANASPVNENSSTVSFDNDENELINEFKIDISSILMFKFPELSEEELQKQKEIE